MIKRHVTKEKINNIFWFSKPSLGYSLLAKEAGFPARAICSKMALVLLTCAHSKLFSAVRGLLGVRKA